MARVVRPRREPHPVSLGSRAGTRGSRGWYLRETADAFEHYVEAVARRLGDRVSDWITQ